ncbi:MAG: carbon monoxide dehydrogenase subunit G [Chloroflexi bacterium]|nr:carbon monoxide dehydrogenase subunit G [Chloroflexota bacterium]
MKIAGDYTFEAPRDLVWEALNDPTVLAKIMPGCEKLVQTAENEYEGALKIKVGPVQGTFQGKIKLSDIKAPESYHMQVDGQGAPGFVKGEGNANLTEQDGKTLLHYDGDAQVGGRIASVGQRLIESSAKSIINQSLHGLHEYIKAKTQAVAAAQVAADTAADTANSEEEAAAARQSAVAAAASAVEPPKITPLSQRQVATTVAKDVMQDLVPANQRPLVYAILALIGVIILVRLFRSNGE